VGSKGTGGKADIKVGGGRVERIHIGCQSKTTGFSKQTMLFANSGDLPDVEHPSAVLAPYFGSGHGLARAEILAILDEDLMGGTTGSGLYILIFRPVVLPLVDRGGWLVVFRHFDELIVVVVVCSSTFERDEWLGIDSDKSWASTIE
jgi:hypothetical protein